MGEEKEKLDRLRAKRGGHRTVVTLKHKQSENYSRTHRFRAYCSLRNEMERNEMERNEMEICSLRNENL